MSPSSSLVLQSALKNLKKLEVSRCKAQLSSIHHAIKLRFVTGELRTLRLDIFIVLVFALKPAAWKIAQSKPHFAKQVLDFDFDNCSAKTLTEDTDILAIRLIGQVKLCCKYCVHMLQAEYGLYCMRTHPTQVDKISAAAELLVDVRCLHRPGLELIELKKTKTKTEPKARTELRPTAAPSMADDRQWETTDAMSSKTANIEPAIDQEMDEFVTSDSPDTAGSQDLLDGWNVAHLDWGIQEEV
ncbi:hypothetical protein CEP52_017266 [Fusarium oligoseptatum]|uniref:Uncharacterized protein n=1 Tax=Fusarium oligoseptatum TaxID=2604345 RepID=A0A428RUF3_9HYPO|nr:hypothetical protein CEP52_017266 [Fusarium oligoseptatum]